MRWAGIGAVACVVLSSQVASGDERHLYLRGGLGLPDVFGLSASLVAWDVLELEMTVGGNPGANLVGARFGPRLTLGNTPTHDADRTITVSLSALGGGRLADTAIPPDPFVGIATVCLATELTFWSGPSQGWSLRGVVGMLVGSPKLLGPTPFPEIALMIGVVPW